MLGWNITVLNMHPGEGQSETHIRSSAVGSNPHPTTVGSAHFIVSSSRPFNFTSIHTSPTLSHLSDLLHPVTSSRSSPGVYKLNRLVLNSAGALSLSQHQQYVWNSLPAQLRLSSSLPTFKKHLKSLLFTSAF